MWWRLSVSHKGGLDERRRRCKTKGAKRLRLGKRRILPQDARWDLDLQILQRGQPLPQTSKGRLSISQVWVKTQIKSKPIVEPANLQQTEKKVGLCSSVKTREVQSHSTWLKAFCHKGTVKDTSIGGWQHISFCIIESFSKKGMMGNHYNVWVPRKQER